MKEKKKFKITGKQIKLMINLISLAVFGVSYLFIYNNYLERAEEAYQMAEAAKLETKVREEKLAEEDSIRTQLVEVKDQAQVIIDGFPVYIAKEDNFMFLEKMEKALKIKVSSIEISDSTVLYETILPAVAEDGAEASGQTDDSNGQTGAAAGSIADNKVPVMTCIQSTISMSLQTSYNGFKELVDYVKNYPEHTIIDNASISYDNSTGNLTGSLVIRRFALTGTGKEYKSAVIDGIDIGTDNIFGTDQE